MEVIGILGFIPIILRPLVSADIAGEFDMVGRKMVQPFDGLLVAESKLK